MKTRTRIGLGVGIALAVLVGWWTLESLLRIDRHRPLLEQELARITGLPVSIERLDLRLLPWPRVSALDPRIGDDAFRFAARRIDLIPDFSSLLRGEVVLRSLRVVRLAVTVPDDDTEAQEAIGALAERIESELAAGADTASGPTLRVERFTAEDIALRRASRAEPVSIASIRATHGADGLSIDWEIETDAPRWDARGTLSLPPGEPSRVTGTMELHALDSDAWVALPDPLRGSVRAEIALDGDPDRQLAFQVRAELASETTGESTPVTGRFRVDRSAPLAVDFSLAADGLDATGALALPEADAPRLVVEALTLEGPAMRMLLSALASPPLALGGDTARLDARAWQVALPADASPRFDAGTVDLQGLEARWDGIGLDTPWRLQGHVEEGTLRVDALASGPLTLSGAVSPGPAWDRAELTLSGDAALDRSLPAAFGLADAIPEIAGRLRLESLRAALPPDPGDPATWQVRVVDGGLTVQSKSFREPISQLALAVDAVGDRIGIEGHATSPRFGAWRVDAKKPAGQERVQGTLRFDAERLGAALPSDGLREALAPLLRAHGPTRLAFDVDAAPPDESIRIVLSRADPPRLDATLAVRTHDGSASLGDLSARAELPAEVLRPLVGDALVLSGSGLLELDRPADAPDLRLVLDTDALDARLGGLLEKRLGEPLRIALRAETRDDGVAPRDLEISARGEALRFRIDDDRWTARDLSLDLGAWSHLLGEGMLADGRIEGDLAFGPLSADLRLVSARLSPSPDLVPATLDGGLRIDDEGIRVDALRVRTAETDVALEGSWRGDTLRGSVTGARLDGDPLPAWIASIRERLPESETTEDEPAPSLSARVDVALDAIGLGGSEGRNAAAAVVFEDGDLRVAPLSLDTYEGRVVGSFDVYGGERLALALDLSDVTGPFLDDLLFAEKPRGISGRFQGALRFEAPLREDLKAMLAAGSGSLVWSARDGSFGRLGLASKLITVLRATDALRLRLPSIRDQGLVFDTVDSTFSMQDGRLQVDGFRLESSVYAVSASGTIDFAEERTNLPIEFDAIRGLSSILAPIPIAGDALKIAHVRLVATGSPYDMKVRVASFRDQVVGASMAVPGATVTRIRDALELLKRRRNGNAATTDATAAAPDETTSGADTASAPTSEEPTTLPDHAEAPEAEADAVEPAADAEGPDADAPAPAADAEGPDAFGPEAEATLP